MAKLDLEIPKLALNDGSIMPMVLAQEGTLQQLNADPVQIGFGTGTAMYKRDGSGMDKERVEQIKTAIRVSIIQVDRELPSSYLIDGIPAPRRRRAV